MSLSILHFPTNLKFILQIGLQTTYEDKVNQ